MKFADLKTQALRYLALGEAEQAFLVYRAIIRQVPEDLDARMKVADVLVHTGLPELACRVYAAVAWCDLQAGRPLHALVCSQALADLGQSTAQVRAIHQSLAALYGQGSQRLQRGRGTGRISTPDPATPIGGLDLGPLPGTLAAESAAEVAADTSSFTAFPSTLLPVPLLSDLSAEAVLATLPSVTVRRLAPRSSVFAEGAPAYSVFFLASGALELRRDQPRALLRLLYEGDVCGELALLEPPPRGRAALAETIEPSDLIELPVRALRAVVDGTSGAAVRRLCADRLGRLALRHSLLLAGAPLPLAERLELLRAFTPQEYPAETVLCQQGQMIQGLWVVLAGRLELLRGQEPFEALEGHLLPGDVYGELALLRPTPAPATLRAVEPAVVLQLPAQALDELSKRVPGLHEHLSHVPQEVLRELGGIRHLLIPPQRAVELPEETEFPFYT